MNSKIKEELLKLTPEENHKGVENHKKIAMHLETAAKYHLEAAMQQEIGEAEKATQSTIIAQGHLRLANETLRMVLLYSFIHLAAF